MKPSKEFIAMLTGVMNGEKWRREKWYKSYYLKRGEGCNVFFHDGNDIDTELYEKPCYFILNTNDSKATDWIKLEENNE